MRLYHLPIVRSFVNFLNTQLRNNTLPHAMKAIVRRSHSKIMTHGLTPKTINILNNNPCIIIANHPHDAEVIAILSALPEHRNDISLIINYRMMGMSFKFDQYCIPVYIDHNIDPVKRYPTISKLIGSFHLKESYNLKNSQKKNRDAIDEAVARLNNGDIVLIFPGRRAIDNNWFSGVGHLSSKIDEKKDAFIIPIYVEGTSDLDCIRMIPFVGKYLPEIKMTFFNPVALSTLSSLDPKEITKKLQKDFEKNVGTLFNKNV